MLTKIYHTKKLKEIVTKVNCKILFHQNVTILSYFLMHLKAVDCQLQMSPTLTLGLISSDFEYIYFTIKKKSGLESIDVCLKRINKHQIQLEWPFLWKKKVLSFDQTIFMICYAPKSVFSEWLSSFELL